MTSTGILEHPISLASASDAKSQVERLGSLETLLRLVYGHLPYSLKDPDIFEDPEASPKRSLWRYFDSHAQEWRAELEREQKSALRMFLSNACRQAPSVKLLMADFRGEVVDLLFVVDGELYEGETQALSIMPRVRRSFPNYLFDVMVVPLSAYESINKWGTEPEFIYRR